MLKMENEDLNRKLKDCIRENRLMEKEMMKSNRDGKLEVCLEEQEILIKKLRQENSSLVSKFDEKTNENKKLQDRIREMA